jgi:glutamine amidotransferase
MTSAGFDDVVRGWIDEDRPYLGICLGLQVLFSASEEPGSERGLGVVEGDVRRLKGDVRIPHIGWNVVDDSYYYFDHSYAVHPADDAVVSGWCEHGERFAASIRRGSILGVQFHPEKSSTAGIRLLKDWVKSL